MDKYLKKIDAATILAALYASLVWVAYFYLNITPDKYMNIIFLITMFIGSYAFLQFIINKIRKSELTMPIVITRTVKCKVFFMTLFVTMGIMLIWILAYYPGSFSGDSIDQYGQALNASYNNWHPAWHTIVFFTLPLKIFGTPASIVIIQNIYFSIVMGYLALTIYEIGGLRVTVISILYILMNPYTGYIMLYPWKDVGFALTGLFCTVFAVRLILMEKKTSKTWKIIVFGVIWASATIFRHNAILYTAPLLIALFMTVNRKTWIRITVISVMSLLMIKIPVYRAFHVTKPTARVLESTGLPLTIIGNVIKETPWLMDQELSEFAYSIASQELWEEKYQCGNFNSIKWNGAETFAVDEAGYAKVLKLTLKCFKISPRASVKAFLALTDMVYGFETGLEGNVFFSDISENKYGIEYPSDSGKVNTGLRIATSSYSSFINSTIFKYFRTYGICLFVLLVIFLGKLKFMSWNSWKKVFLVVPLFVYDFGTMLLLTGPDSRFFFITFLVTPILVVYALNKGENEDNE